MWPQSKHIAKRLYPFPASLPLGSHSENQKMNFARDLQERLGILALLALPALFRICKLQIPLATRETDPVSGHHLESTTYKRPIISLPFGRLSRVLAKYHVLKNMVLFGNGRVLVVRCPAD
jgi:hypothetical protein